MTQAPVFGFIGLGDMGLPMARRLLATGHPVVAWNRSPGKVQTLVAEGAEAAATPADVMARANLIGMCLTSHETVEAVGWGPDGLFSASAVPAGRVIVDFSTGAADAARDFAARTAEAGAGWLDCPVSGGVPAAEAGKLILFAGGDAEHVAQAAPLFEAVGQRTSHMGPSGSGQMTKICNQMMVACNMLAMAEAIALARKAGVAVERLPEALRGGFADSTPFQIFGPRMAGHQFEPRLGAISLMGKDAGLAAGVAAEVGATTPLLDRVRELYARIADTPGVATDEDLSKVIALFEPIGDR